MTEELLSINATIRNIYKNYRELYTKVIEETTIVAEFSGGRITLESSNLEWVNRLHVGKSFKLTIE